MDAPLNHHRHPTLPNGGAAVKLTDEISSGPSSSGVIEGTQSTATVVAKRKNKKKKEIEVSDSASSNNCSCPQKGFKISRNPKRIRVGSMSRRSVGLSDVDALGLPLGMSIAAVVAQVLERKNAAGEKMSVDYLSEICVLAVREALGNVFGDKFDNFVMNFETSFRSTLMTLRLISGTSHIDGEQLQRVRFRGCSCLETSNVFSPDTLKYSACPSEATEGLPHTEQQQRAGYQDGSFEASTVSSHDRIEDSTLPSGDTDHPEVFLDRTGGGRRCDPQSQMEENLIRNPLSQQLVLHRTHVEQQLACDSRSTSSMLSTIEKSVMEQTRSNDLKKFEIGLIMKKLQLKERQLELTSNANFLEKWKLSMGFSKASFKEEKFKTQLQDSRQVELLRNCLDFLVSGLFIMLFSLAYGTYVYSHRRIIEATEACSPYTDSKSWWMPKSMSSFNSGLQSLKCQIQVLSRMLFGALMILAIAFLLIQRSASSHQTMPITFILLLLGVGCGYAGKFCIDTLGGSGNHWLIYWEALCSLHFLSCVFYSTLFTLLYGPIKVVERAESNPVVPYWTRKLLFFATLLFLPLLCGLMPFAGPREWFDHFSDLFTFIDD